MNMVQKHKWFGTHTSYFYDDLLRQIMDKNRIQMLLFVFLACFCFHIQISDDKIVSTAAPKNPCCYPKNLTTYSKVI